jgi:C4-dicarboxylate-specific signal transduction histidine kinase
VSDTGPGIPAEDRVAILRPFVTSSVRHGIGLGLPVSAELAQEMSGTLVLGDRAGGGAALTLSLPLAPGSGDSPSAVPASGLVAE